ncbi:carboxypeptidase regulatory-like domain-containing protein [Paenibacillus elgii]|nr:carboxypeptidase regulatory-like domain-containing protein [Paenibacillus elgii]
MKRKRSVGKAVLSFCLAVLLVWQTLMFSAAAFAASEGGSPSGDEPSSVTEAVYAKPDEPPPVTRAVYAKPVNFAAMQAVPADKTAVLMGANSPFPLEVIQDGNVLKKGDAIHGRKPFSLKSSDIKVPVKGDAADPNTVDGSTVILYGDWVMLDKATYFPEVILPAATMTLKERSGYTIGTAYFSEAGIKVVFNGEERFFNGQGRNITFGFESTAKADVSGIDYGRQKPIGIFGAGYMLENPNVTPAYNINLKSNSNAAENDWIYTAHLTEGTIEWQVEIAAKDMFDPTIPQLLDGLKLYNALDPIQVGTYVEGSLKVNGSSVTPDSGTTNALAYTFTAGFGDKATVTFKTWIPKGKYYREYNSGSSGYETVTNTAELRNASDSKLLSSNSWRVAFKPDWIQKSGTLDKRSGSADPRTITWTIDVNKNYSKQGLKNFTITDALPAGLAWRSAAWQSWDSAKKDWSATSTPITPDANNVYSFGEVNGPIRLVIVSEVSGNTTGFTNTATAQWKLDVNTVQDNDQATVRDAAAVTIGAHTLTKTTSTGDTLGLGILPWKVTLTPQEALPDGAVYDLLVYGDANSIDFTKVTASPEIDAGILNQLKGNNGARYFQRFQSGSFQSSDGLTHQVYTLSQDGKPVADLLRVTGYNTDAPASFTFNSLMTQWQHFANNNSTTHYNQAFLFEGTKRTRDSSLPYHQVNSGMLAKEMLYASKPAGTSVNPGYVNHYIRNDANEAHTLAAYDQVTKTVTFRLSVNMNGLKTEAMAKDGGNHVASDIKLVDTLPVGWEFVPYSEGQAFAIYKGTRAEYGATVSAATLISDPSDLVSFSAAGNIGTFSFTKLESPYVVLVKARPAEAALRQYFETGKAKHEMTNTAEMKITWGDEPTTVTAARKVIVPMQSLGKSVTKPNPGVLEWTVNYTPPFEVKDGVYLQDTLGQGLALRKDESGNLSLRRPDMAVYRAKLTPSGELTRDGDALNLYDPNSAIKVETVTEGGATRLIFRIANPNQLYQIVYQTEVTEVPSGGKVGNEIKLMGDDTLKSVSAKSEHAVDNSDVGGSADTQGKLDLVKVDPKGKPLGGVIFTLYEPDGITEVTSGTTGSDGKLSLFVKAGLYVLKQTYIDPITYLPTTTVYQVRVASTPWNPIWVDGVEVTSAKPLVVPTPVWEAGHLKLDTAIEGKAADPNKEFEYTITFSNGKSYAYSGAISGIVPSGGTVKLKGGQAITIKDIPDGITYTIVQKGYTDEGYATNPADLKRTGSIVANETVEAKFVNGKYLPGKLTIGQTVAGNGADKNKAFEFTVTFEGAGAGKTYTYTTSGGTTGTIGSGGKFSLKHGETAVIDGIPKDTIYTVTETDYTGDGYTTTWRDWKTNGTIAEEGDHKEEVVNTRMVYGGLLIGQTVEGSGADKNKGFEFTVQFPDAAAGDPYAYTKSDGTTGTIRSGETITLKHGQTIAIEGIPSGVRYIVTETDYSGEGYTTDPVTRTHSGTIIAKQIAEARFVNAKHLSGKLTLTADPAVVPGNGTTPSQLTATLTDYEGKPVANQDVVFTLPDQSEVTAKTDAQGKAVIPYTPPKLGTTTPEDHHITAKVNSLTEGKLTAATTVTAVPAAIIGVLRDNTTGEVIPNATVVITNEANGEKQTITTDAAGAYFLPVAYGGDYTISFTKKIKMNGVDESITFTQKAEVDSNVKGGELVPAHITAVGVVLLKQPEGKSSLLNSTLAGKARIYLRDASGKYIVDQNGTPKAFGLQPNGAFAVNGLSAAHYKMEVRYEVEPGRELTLIRDAGLDVKANGELNISQQLVDPYGIVSDATTRATIEGAEVMLYYADTPKNKANGIVAGTKVTLPMIPGFAPNDNASPSQNSDVNGAYAYMVFPDTDYCLVVTKPGYETYTSPTISVGSDIVRYDVQLKPVSSGGNDGGTEPGNPGPVKPKPGEGDSGTGSDDDGSDNVDNGTREGNKGPGNVDNGTRDGNKGPGNADNGTREGNKGPGNVDNGTRDGNKGPGNVDNGTRDGNKGPGNVDNGTREGNKGPGNVDNGTREGNKGPGNVDNGTREGNKGPGNVDNGSREGNKGPGNVDNELDDVPKTGDSSVSPIFYMALALMSLITIGLCLLDRKKKKHIQ